MKQNEKVVPDGIMKSAIRCITECQLRIDVEFYNECCYYFDDAYEDSFKGKSLPPQKHIAKLILQDTSFKKSVEELANYAAKQFMYAFENAEESAVEDERERVEEEKEAALLEETQQKLLNGSSEEQIIPLHETFNITE
jgi:hypothetical protein